MSLRTCPFVKTKSNKVVKQQYVKQKKSSGKEESKDTDTNEETKVASICSEVESMMQKSTIEESVEQTVQRKETLQKILSMLDSKSEGQQKTENQEIYIDEPNTSAVVDSESTEKTVGT